ncbi:hypothetical protein K504DRAFT_303707 [Pleomassaria siparia CBS 279.74]|uniref:Uncharacterized protein n=1 Tax=Pleomassaria siparia CBS 279.74 TaxID=1314801 RepID=A0A6G1K797_9PLEO|nr:hypothetical protein K504DRAFT_303707 [Pleomassaria siparia CBS 279.74]
MCLRYAHQQHVCQIRYARRKQEKSLSTSHICLQGHNMKHEAIYNLLWKPVLPVVIAAAAEFVGQGILFVVYGGGGGGGGGGFSILSFPIPLFFIEPTSHMYITFGFGELFSALVVPQCPFSNSYKD